jgi:predicted metal-binding protein
MKLMLSEIGFETFDFLRELALERGAVDAKVISTDQIVIENRIVLKCKIGCANYGKTLACPPYTPSVEDFKKIINEYKYALFMKFKSEAKADPEIMKHLSKTENDQAIPREIQDKLQGFWAAWKADKLRMLSVVLDIEKAVMNKGYPLAVGLVSGFCQLCEKCTLDRKSCVYPAKARYSQQAVGVNVQATAKNSGIKVTFPFEETPESFALILID